MLFSRAWWVSLSLSLSLSRATYRHRFPCTNWRWIRSTRHSDIWQVLPFASHGKTMHPKGLSILSREFYITKESNRFLLCQDIPPFPATTAVAFYHFTNVNENKCFPVLLSPRTLNYTTQQVSVGNRADRRRGPNLTSYLGKSPFWLVFLLLLPGLLICWNYYFFYVSPLSPVDSIIENLRTFLRFFLQKLRCSFKFLIQFNSIWPTCRWDKTCRCVVECSPLRGGKLR